MTLKETHIHHRPFPLSLVPPLLLRTREYPPFHPQRAVRACSLVVKGESVLAPPSQALTHSLSLLRATSFPRATALAHLSPTKKNIQAQGSGNMLRLSFWTSLVQGCLPKRLDPSVPPKGAESQRPPAPEAPAFPSWDAGPSTPDASTPSRLRFCLELSSKRCARLPPRACIWQEEKVECWGGLGRFERSTRLC